MEKLLAALEALVEACIALLTKPTQVDVILPSMTPKPTPTPSQPATPPTTQPVQPQGLLEAFCQEIKNMEGWSVGSASYNRKNPGNLRCPPLNSLAIKCEGGFCVFKDEATGMQGLRNVTTAQANGASATYNAAAKKLGLKGSADLNLYQYFRIRDPATDNNQPDLLAERFGRVLGVDPSTFTMRQLLN